jgi:aminodeoxyfutalosine synthase
MATAAHALSDLEARAGGDQPYTRTDADRVAACPDLISVGMLGEGLRKAWRGQRVTYGRVLDVAGVPPDAPGEAGEIRLIGAPASADDARRRVQAAVAMAAGRPVTGFSLDELAAIAAGDVRALADLATALRADGLESVADVPLDRLGGQEQAAAWLAALSAGGLGAWRATIHRADGLALRLDLIEMAAGLQAGGAGFRAFAPLPRIDPRDAPSTGYEDVRTVAIARLLCRAIPAIQVDWALYGPKLAQVAIAYGADDIDAVPPADVLQLGHRRSPREDLERQIRAAFAEPAERNGRYEAIG